MWLQGVTVSEPSAGSWSVLESSAHGEIYCRKGFLSCFQGPLLVEGEESQFLEEGFPVRKD